MASSKTKRRSRKARAARRAESPAQAQPQAPAGPRVTPRVGPAKPPATRRQQREERERRAARDSAAAGGVLGKYGEPPKSIFAPIPVAEVAVLAGIIGVIVGLIDRGNPSLWVGALVCAGGVLEFTSREHFSGYRSHSTLLAAVPAVAVEVIIALTVGIPSRRAFLLLPCIPVFALSFWLLRRSFASARHTRVVRS